MAAFGMGGFGGGPGGLGALGAALGAVRPGFEEQYHCYPVSYQVLSAESCTKGGAMKRRWAATG